MQPLIPLAWAFLMPALQAADPIDAYPPAENGMTRHVLTLPEEKDSSMLRKMSKSATVFGAAALMEGPSPRDEINQPKKPPTIRAFPRLTSDDFLTNHPAQQPCL